jgi:hypothetical protein
VPVLPTGVELSGITVRLEELAADRPFTAVVLEFRQDDEPTEYLLSVAQARDLHRVIGTVLRQVPAAG